MNNNKQEQLFLEDVEQGLIENVKKHIEMKHVNIISCMDGERRNALHRASLEGHSLIVKLLLDTIKTDPMYSLKQNKITKFVNKTDVYGNTAIYLACVHQQETSAEIVKLLLEQNARRCPRKITTGMTPLHFASYNGDYDAVQVLLDGIAIKDILMLNKDKKTALDIAGEQYIKYKATFKSKHSSNFKNIINAVLNKSLTKDEMEEKKLSSRRKRVYLNFRYRKLYWASAIGNVEVIVELLKHYQILPTKPIKYEKNRSPLHIAVLMKK